MADLNGSALVVLDLCEDECPACSEGVEVMLFVPAPWYKVLWLLLCEVPRSLWAAKKDLLWMFLLLCIAVGAIFLLGDEAFYPIGFFVAMMIGYIAGLRESARVQRKWMQRQHEQYEKTVRR